VNNRREEPDNRSILTDDAWDYIAKMLSPDEPVRKPTKHDSWLINNYHPPNYPNDMHRYRGFGAGPKTWAPPELIPQIDRAYFRLSQMLRVMDWFEEKGIDIEQPTIPKHLFEAAVQAEFGQLPPESVKPREKYKRNTTDDALVAEAIEGLESKKFANVNQAALFLAPRADGSEQTAARRLNRKIADAYNVKPRQNVSKQIKTSQKI
jgi:hypothetical protein